nr:MAG TPA: hypothetical protein [Caudoviricetes sp.]
MVYKDLYSMDKPILVKFQLHGTFYRWVDVYIICR